MKNNVVDKYECFDMATETFNMLHTTEKKREISYHLL